jgi:hypothetical protein
MKKFSLPNRFLLMLALSLVIFSCKKDDEKDPAPDLSTKVIGIYKFSEIAFNGKVIPADESNLKGDIRLVKKTATTVDAELDIRLKSTNEEFMVYDVSDLELSESNGVVEVVYEGEKVAEIKGKKIMVNGTDEVGVDFTVTATR